MKRTICLVLAIGLLFALGGCAELDRLKSVDLPPLPTISLESPEPEQASPTEPEFEQSYTEPKDFPILLHIQHTGYEEYDPAEGKQLILSFSYDTPQLNMEGNEAAAERINESVARLNESFYTGESYGEEPEGQLPYGYLRLLEEAEDNFTYAHDSGLDLALEFSASRSVRVERMDDKLLSLVFSDSIYTGGVHGSYDDMAVLYSTETGERVKLEDLGPDVEGLKSFLSEWMLNSLDEETRDYYASFLYEKDLPQALSDLLRDGSWYLDGEGMMVFSDLYELASYADGIISFHIPYAELTPFIDEKWLPVSYNTEGTLSVSALSEIPEGSLWMLDRLVLDENGQEWCLLVEGEVRDLELCSCYYSDYTESFYAHELIWRADRLKDCGIQIKTEIPDGLPDLMLRYRGEEGIERILLLSQSGLDGKPILVEDTVKAVG